MNIRPLCAARNLLRTRSRRSGSATRDRGRIEFPIFFNSWTSFSSNSGFVSGLNTLAFLVANASFATFAEHPRNPTGLRVEFVLSNVNVAAIPEPEIYAMLAAGLGLMGFVARRRRQQLAAA